FPADVRAGAAVNVAFQLARAAEDALRSENLLLVPFPDRLLQHLRLSVIFAADVDVGDVALRGDGADGDAFQQLVRVVIDQITVLERPRFRLIRIHREIVRPLFFLGDEGPLLPRREPRPAAPAQAGVGHGLDDLVRLHLQRFAQRDVAAAGDVIVVADQLALVWIERDAPGEDGFVEGHDSLVARVCNPCFLKRHGLKTRATLRLLLWLAHHLIDHGSTNDLIGTIGELGFVNGRLLVHDLRDFGLYRLCHVTDLAAEPTEEAVRTLLFHQSIVTSNSRFA